MNDELRKHLDERDAINKKMVDDIKTVYEEAMNKIAEMNKVDSMIAQTARLSLLVLIGIGIGWAIWG